jgi:hypothetical protein
MQTQVDDTTQRLARMRELLRTVQAKGSTTPSLVKRDAAMTLARDYLPWLLAYVERLRKKNGTSAM